MQNIGMIPKILQQTTLTKTNNSNKCVAQQSLGKVTPRIDLPDNFLKASRLQKIKWSKTSNEVRGEGRADRLHNKDV